MTFFDDLGNEINFEKKPKKIASLVPCITETLYDLNLEEFIVGITKCCIYPAHFKHTKEIIGEPQNIDLGKIKELKPDIIFCDQQQNSTELIKELQKISQVYVLKINTINESKHMILKLGTLLNRRTEANLLNQKLDLKLNNFRSFITDSEFKKVVYFVGYHPWLVAGNNTYTNSLLILNKFDNIYKNLENYSEINPKKIRYDGDPEVLFFPSEPFCFKDEHAFEISEYTNRSGAVFVNGEMFSWYGSRLIRAFDYFKILRSRLNEGSSFLK